MMVKCLIENTTDNPTLISEHGLSLYIEGHDHRILFDLGMTGAFADNARIMGVDIASVDTVIVSHGHYDHGGGLSRFFELNDHGTVWMSDSAFGDYYSSRNDGTMAYIGLDPMLNGHPRIRKVGGRQKIADCLEVFSNESSEEPLPVMNRYLSEKVNGDYVADRFQHEINLKFNCDGKSILIAGCAHNGIENILNTYMKQEGAEPNAVIGGFHLSSGSRKERPTETSIRHLGRYLSSYETEFFTCHCTGIRAYEFLRQEMKKQIGYLSSGASVHL